MVQDNFEYYKKNETNYYMLPIQEFKNEDIGSFIHSALV